MPQVDLSCATQLEVPPYVSYGPTFIYNSVGQLIGYLGTSLGNLVPYQPPIFHYTDPVLVGPTTSDDIDWDFIQSSGQGVDAFDEGDQVSVDASASKNYTMWFMAIKERGGQDRYLANGWKYGEIDDPLDLSTFWAQGGAWIFEAFNQYDVQIAIENQHCRNGIEWPGTTWTVLEKQFFVCPAGTGCRFAVNREMKQLNLYPNPASNYVNLENYQPDLHGTLNLRISDMAGRLRINSEINEQTIDLSHLESGMYVVKILHKNNELHSSRLIIQ